MGRWKIDVEKGEIYTREGLSKHLGIRGYKTVSSTYNGRKYDFKQHQIIVIAAGLNPVGKQINHIDGNKLNNSISNLEVVTPSENLRHAFRMGLAKTVNRLFSDSDVRDIRSKLRNGDTAVNIARIYGTSPEVIGRLKRKETYKNVPDVEEAE